MSCTHTHTVHVFVVNRPNSDISFKHRHDFPVHVNWPRTLCERTTRGSPGQWSLLRCYRLYWYIGELIITWAFRNSSINFNASRTTHGTATWLVALLFLSILLLIKTVVRSSSGFCSIHRSTHMDNLRVIRRPHGRLGEMCCPIVFSTLLINVGLDVSPSISYYHQMIFRRTIEKTVRISLLSLITCTNTRYNRFGVGFKWTSYFPDNMQDSVDAAISLRSTKLTRNSKCYFVCRVSTRCLRNTFNKEDVCGCTRRSWNCEYRCSYFSRNIY